MVTSDVIIETCGRVGRLRLNRSRALHALTLPMCRAIVEALLRWTNDPGIAIVAIDHSEGRGFCAGGDILALAESGSRDGREAAEFFRTEYQLNHLLFTYAKPVVAFMDGVTMGGGVGLALPCRYRIATENTRFAMPESGIGLFPDVGGGWYLSRLPGRIGAWLALTGETLTGADCRALGIATDYIQANRLERVKQMLIEPDVEIATILADWASVPPAANIDTIAADIDRLFASDRYEDILAALRADGGEWAASQLSTLSGKSNVTCKVSLRQLAESKRFDDFADEMRMEYRLATRICRTHDFIEGVRALLIDKDRSPRWQPTTPEGVTPSAIDELFAPLPTGEEWVPLARCDHAP